MRILIGYSMRSGSTLLQHLLNQHSQVHSYSDVSSLPVLAALKLRLPLNNICVKPLDLFYLRPRIGLLKHFDKFVWLTRDPRDSYLSSIRSGYAYLFWRRGRRIEEIDVGLLERWQRIHRHYFNDRGRWHLVRYEDLTQTTGQTTAALLTYLGLPTESLRPFDKFVPVTGGDMQLTGQTDVHANSVARYTSELTPAQLKVFRDVLGDDMTALGYPA